MIPFSRYWLTVTSTVLLVACPIVSHAQEVGDRPLPAQLDEADERVTNDVSTLNTASLNQRQPISKAELDLAYGPESLSIVNEQLRQEIELLAREYRESERRNEIQLFGLGALVSLIFLGIGFLIGKRFGGRRLL